MSGFIFLGSEEDSEILHEGLGNTPATSFKMGEDNTGNDKTGDDDTGLDPAMKDDTGEDETGDDDTGDELDDGDPSDEDPDESDPDNEESADDTTDTATDAPVEGQEESPADTILMRKKKELYSFYTDLLNVTEDLNKATSLENIKDKFDASSQKVIAVIRETSDTSSKILRSIIVNDFKNESYENLLFLYTRHLSTIKLASDIFKGLNEDQ